MKMPGFLSKSILFAITVLGIAPTAMAQKVKSVQEGSVWAPANVKIDGKLAEWSDALQAYNKTTRLWYTVANDDKSIYLVVKSTDPDNNNKVLAGGISFTLNTADKKKDKNAFIITFPVISRTGMRGHRRGGMGGQQDTPDSAAVIAQQKQLLATSKEISAIGFKEITDTLISIYNEYEIKAAANIDEKGNFVYELAIPLKMLGLSTDIPTEIAYNIKVNGLQLGGNGDFKAGGNFGGAGVSLSGGGGGGRGGGGGFGGGFGGGGAFGNRGGSDTQDLTSPTDFWGKYTLATNKNTPAK